MAKIKVKVNPVYDADAVGDEILGVTFTKNEWTEVNGSDWKDSKNQLVVCGTVSILYQCLSKKDQIGR